MNIKNSASYLFIFVFICFSNFLSAQENKAFLEPPQIIQLQDSLDGYAKEDRKFTGIPSLAISEKGRMWAVWYTGITPNEDNNNYVVVATSGDQGDTWKEIVVVDPDAAGPVRAYDPEVWMAPDGNLWVFWAQAIGHNGTVAGVWAMTTENPDDENPKWSKPKRLTDGVMMCKPLVLSSGEWILPASTWRLTDNSAKVIVSTNKGKSWKERGAVNVPKDVRSFDEQMIIERKDGSLWMLVRTNYGIGESTSTDKGKSWSALVPSKIKHPSARFFISKLMSGNLLLVKHGPIEVRTGRSNLMAFISKDDGHSWSKGLLIDQRSGVSYPDGQQTSDGNIQIIYDFDRSGSQNILTTSFTEEDILSGQYDEKIIEVFDRRKVVSKGGIE